MDNRTNKGILSTMEVRQWFGDGKGKSRVELRVVVERLKGSEGGRGRLMTRRTNPGRAGSVDAGSGILVRIGGERCP